jgi:hypothetical protein
MLTAADGYLLDTYACKVVMRCGDPVLYGSQINCNEPDADTALLMCDGEPGNKHDFVNVANTDTPFAKVYMPWKHEIYSVSSSNADLVAHYSTLDFQENNFHYFGGPDDNQLLPLVSTDYVLLATT